MSIGVTLLDSILITEDVNYTPTPVLFQGPDEAPGPPLAPPGSSPRTTPKPTSFLFRSSSSSSFRGAATKPGRTPPPPRVPSLGVCPLMCDTTPPPQISFPQPPHPTMPPRTLTRGS